MEGATWSDYPGADPTGSDTPLTKDAREPVTYPSALAIRRFLLQRMGDEHCGLWPDTLIHDGSKLINPRLCHGTETELSHRGPKEYQIRACSNNLGSAQRPLMTDLDGMTGGAESIPNLVGKPLTVAELGVVQDCYVHGWSVARPDSRVNKRVVSRSVELSFV